MICVSNNSKIQAHILFLGSDQNAVKSIDALFTIYIALKVNPTAGFCIMREFLDCNIGDPDHYLQA